MCAPHRGSSSVPLFIAHRLASESDFPNNSVYKSMACFILMFPELCLMSLNMPLNYAKPANLETLLEAPSLA